MIRAAVLVLAVVLAAVAGCSRTSSPPRVEIGTPCATCGMAIQEIRFAGLLRGDGGDRPYDSIECLVKGMTERVARAYLSDYDQGTLHAAESVWVVNNGEIWRLLSVTIPPTIDLPAPKSRRTRPAK